MQMPKIVYSSARVRRGDDFTQVSVQFDAIANATDAGRLVVFGPGRADQRRLGRQRHHEVRRRVAVVCTQSCACTITEWVVAARRGRVVKITMEDGERWANVRLPRSGSRRERRGLYERFDAAGWYGDQGTHRDPLHDRSPLAGTGRWIFRSRRPCTRRGRSATRTDSLDQLDTWKHGGRAARDRCSGQRMAIQLRRESEP